VTRLPNCPQNLPWWRFCSHTLFTIQRCLTGVLHAEGLNTAQLNHTGNVGTTKPQFLWKSNVLHTTWFKYDRDKLWLVYTQIVPVIFEPPCISVWACVCGCTDTGVCLRACSLTNLTCNAPTYCLLQPLWLHHIFRHYLTHGTIFGKKKKKAIEHKMCVLISTIFIRNVSHSKKN
jgi:hypothetical protein